MGRFVNYFLSALLLVGSAVAQAPLLAAAEPMRTLPPPFVFPFSDVLQPGTLIAPPASELPQLATPAELPRMSPELALQTYQNRMVLQSVQLASYSSTTLIRAQLPQTSQQAEFELERHFSAPHTLAFKAIHFVGDSFVKTNIITRLLQSDVDHVQKDDSALTALSQANYKFSYKGTAEVLGRTVHVFQVKPRKKRVGLFKGRIFIDAYSGSLVRAEGTAVKSPSFFVRKIEFVQDYVDVGSFTFPSYIHSEAKARIIGRTVVDIYQSDYHVVAKLSSTTQDVAGVQSN